MQTNYNHGYNHGAGQGFNASVTAAWIRIDSIYPCGAFVPVSTSYPKGTKIPLGTPVELDKMNGTLKLGSTATNPIGLTQEDVWVGTDGVSIDIVDGGVLNESVIEATITAAQKGKLATIKFFKEA